MQDFADIDELIDLYVLGKLDKAQRDELEALMFCSPELFKLVEEREALLAIIRENPELIQARSSWHSGFLIALSVIREQLSDESMRIVFMGIAAAIALFCGIYFFSAAPSIPPDSDSPTAQQQTGVNNGNYLKSSIIDLVKPDSALATLHGSVTEVQVFEDSILFSFRSIPHTPVSLRLVNINGEVYRTPVTRTAVTVPFASLKYLPGKYLWKYYVQTPDGDSLLQEGDFYLTPR